MRTYICLMVAGAALVPTVLAGQRPPARPAARSTQAAQAPTAKNEFGVDLGLAWVSPDVGDSRFRIGSPVDLRIGFVSRGRLMWEPRLSLAFDSEGLGGDAAYTFSPQVVALYSMTPQRHRAGWYLFGGAGLNLVNAGIPTVDGGTTFSMGAGLGTRKRLGNAALRLEGGLRYDTEDSGAGMPSQFSIGTRAGLSFWH
jgi:hypothetical protein